MAKLIFTEEKLSLIRTMVGQRASPDEIAGAVGCTVGTLRVRCSNEGISLSAEEKIPPRVVLKISNEAMERLKEQAAAKRVTIDKLSSTLIEIICNEKMFDAVLDGAI